MTTKLDGVLKRELSIRGEPYTLTLSGEGFTLALKGRRKGLDILWADLVGGEAALATALNASLTANIGPRSKVAAMPAKVVTAKSAKVIAKPAKPAAKRTGRPKPKK